MSHISQLNGLVREAFSAQEAFHNWDRGKTYGSAFAGPRLCALDEVVGELHAANLKLVQFAVHHREDLLSALAARAIARNAL